MKVTGLKVFLPLMAVMGVIGFQAVAEAASVGLKVSADQTQLEATTRGNCSQNNTNGCVRASGVMQINFNLGQASCASGGNWALSQVYLGNSKNNWGNISSTAANDFDANASSGLVTPISQNPTHIGIRNNNSQAYSIWYTVTATCGSSTIELDPRIVNDGTGRP